MAEPEFTDESLESFVTQPDARRRKSFTGRLIGWLRRPERNQPLVERKHFPAIDSANGEEIDVYKQVHHYGVALTPQDLLPNHGVEDEIMIVGWKITVPGLGGESFPATKYMIQRLVPKRDYVVKGGLRLETETTELVRQVTSVTFYPDLDGYRQYDYGDLHAEADYSGLQVDVHGRVTFPPDTEIYSMMPKRSLSDDQRGNYHGGYCLDEEAQAIHVEKLLNAAEPQPRTVA